MLGRSSSDFKKRKIVGCNFFRPSSWIVVLLCCNGCPGFRQYETCFHAGPLGFRVSANGTLISWTTSLSHQLKRLGAELKQHQGSIKFGAGFLSRLESDRLDLGTSIRLGDQMINFNGVKINTFGEVKDRIKQARKNASKQVCIGFKTSRPPDVQVRIFWPISTWNNLSNTPCGGDKRCLVFSQNSQLTPMQLSSLRPDEQDAFRLITLRKHSKLLFDFFWESCDAVVFNPERLGSLQGKRWKRIKLKAREKTPPLVISFNLESEVTHPQYSVHNLNQTLNDGIKGPIDASLTFKLPQQQQCDDIDGEVCKPTDIGVLEGYNSARRLAPLCYLQEDGLSEFGIDLRKRPFIFSKQQKIPAAAVFISDCNQTIAHWSRMKYVLAFRRQLRLSGGIKGLLQDLHIYGRCGDSSVLSHFMGELGWSDQPLHNVEEKRSKMEAAVGCPPFDPYKKTQHTRALNKACIASKYEFILAVENVQETDYVTEKLFQALRADSIVMYHGAPNAHKEFFPVEGCALDISRFGHNAEQTMFHLIGYKDEQNCSVAAQCTSGVLRNSSFLYWINQWRNRTLTHKFVQTLGSCGFQPSDPSPSPLFQTKNERVLYFSQGPDLGVQGMGENTQPHQGYELRNSLATDACRICNFVASVLSGVQDWGSS